MQQDCSLHTKMMNHMKTEHWQREEEKMSKIYRCEKNHLLDAIEVVDEDGKCLCPHDNTRCHLDADTEDKQRIAELEKENAELKEQLEECEFRINLLKLRNHLDESVEYEAQSAINRVIELEKENTELVAENERMRCCGNCENVDELGMCDIGDHDWIEKFECINNNRKHWKREETK